MKKRNRAVIIVIAVLLMLGFAVSFVMSIIYSIL